MRITYDPKYDLLYIKLGEAEKVLCKEVDEDITFRVGERLSQITCRLECLSA